MAERKLRHFFEFNNKKNVYIYYFDINCFKLCTIYVKKVGIGKKPEIKTTRVQSITLKVPFK